MLLLINFTDLMTEYLTNFNCNTIDYVVCDLYIGYQYLNASMILLYLAVSRLTGSESRGQEEAACAHPANATTSVLFTGTNTVKFPSSVTRSSYVLPLSYYRASTFLPCRISKPKMNELSCTVVEPAIPTFMAPVSLSKAET